MSFNLTGNCIPLYFTLSMRFLYFEIRSAAFITGNRYAKSFIIFIIFILVIAFLIASQVRSDKYENNPTVDI